MPISDVASITISVSGAGPTRAGFGEPLIAAKKVPFNGVREYSTLTGMVSDGFLVTDPAYLMAQQLASQQPSVPAWKVSKRSLAYTQTLHLTLLSVSNLDTYTISLRLPGGTYSVVTTPSTGVPATDVATLNTLVTALSIAGLTATHSGAILTLTMTAGLLLDVKPGLASLITFADVTTDPGVATDLAAILAQDSNWYGLLLDCQSPAEITAATAWAESNGKLFIYNSSDTECGDPASTTDIFYTEKALNHARSAGIFAYTSLLSYTAAAWMGKLFPTDAGSENWAFKTLSGVPVDVLTDTQIHAIENKNASVYTSLLGAAITQFGKQPGGEWIDVTRGIDAFTNDLQVGVVAMQTNTIKVPFTDLGGDMIRSVIQASITRFTDRNFLALVPAPVIFIPLVANIASTDRAARNFTGVSFSAQVAGAVNKVTLNGVLTQ
jgi:uncharacterized protein DUF3383